MEGPGVFEIIAKATPVLAYFDRYALGNPRSELFMEDQADLDGRIAECEKAWEEAKATGKNGGRFVSGFNNPGLYWARRIANYLRNPPKWLLEKRDAEMKNTKFAKEDVGYDESKGDVFIPSELMQGGIYFGSASDWSGRGKRGVKYVNVGMEVSMKFSCELFPPEAPMKLFVTGQGFSDKAQPDLSIELNGHVIWRGEHFKPRYFTTLEVGIPVNAVRRTNTLVIRNVSPLEENWRKPLIHYVVIRR